MKKLFILAMIVLGTNLAQAQGNISLIAFSDSNSSSNNFALAAGNLTDNKCVAVKAASGDNGAIDAVATAEVFTYNAGTRELFLNGNRLTSVSIDEASFYTGLFDGNYNTLFRINSAGEYVYIRDN